MTETYALIGAAGHIAPRHMEAIRDTGGDLVAAHDPSDSVSIIDGYFPDAEFFTAFERFEHYTDSLRRQPATSVKYVSICSPSYLHDSHIRFSLRSGSNAICETPLVLNPWNIDGLVQMQAETGLTVNTIMQLRLHPTIVALRSKIHNEARSAKYEVDLSYVTARGRWYNQSWYGADDKSGGIATAAGFHYFDMLHFLFGALQGLEVHLSSPTRAAGYLEFEKARVRWFMSLDVNDLPKTARDQGNRTYRSLTVNDEEIEFSESAVNLHTLSYEEILAGRGFGLEDNRAAIDIVSSIRNSAVTPNPSAPHLLLQTSPVCA